MNTSYSYLGIGGFTTPQQNFEVANPGKQKFQCIDATLINLKKNRFSNLEAVNYGDPTFQAWTLSETTPTISYDVTEAPFYDSQSTIPSAPGKASTSAVNISLYVIVFIVAVIGNILVIVTIASNRRMKTLTNIFLLSMAVSDLLIAFICMPINLTGRILTQFVFGSFMCRIFPYITGVSVMVSAYTMLAISIERYFAICSPFGALARQSKKHAYTVIVCIWIASFVVMLPYAIASKLGFIPVPLLNKCVKACRLSIANRALFKAWYAFLLIGLFCVPGLVMAVAYVRVCITLYGGFQFKTTRETNGTSGDEPQSTTLLSKPQQYSTSTLMPPSSKATTSTKRTADNDSRAVQTSSQSRTNRRAVVMLILIVIFYFILWSPLYIANLWKAFDYMGAVKHLESSIEMIKLMSYISTCVNPVIYCFMNKKFRDGFITAFLCCLPAKCAQKVKTQRLGHSHAITETQQTTIVTSSKITRRSMSPV